MAEDAVASYQRVLALKPDFAAAFYAFMYATAFFCDSVRMRSRLKAAAPAGAKVLRTWIPACSTGQEVYSLAILMTELMGGTPAAPRVELIGTGYQHPCSAPGSNGLLPRAT